MGRLVLLCCGLLMLFTACDILETDPTRPPTDTPVSTPSPNPDLEATIEARAQKRLQEILAMTPSPIATPSVLPTATPTPSDRSPYQMLAESIAATEKASSFHFEMDTRMTVLAEGFRLEIPLKFIGDTRVPDRIQGTVSISIFGETNEFGIISIGDMTYTRDLGFGDWELTDEPDFPFAAPGDFTETDPSDIEDLVLVGVESLDGTEMYHLRGTLPSEALRDFREAFWALEVDFQVEYWIGVDDSFLRQISAKAEFRPEEDEELFFGFSAADATTTVVVTMKLSDFGRRVVIRAPDLSFPTPFVLPTPTPERFGRPAPTATTPFGFFPTPALTPAIAPTPFRVFRPTATPAPTATPQPFDVGLLVSPDPNPKKGGTLKVAALSGVSLFDLHQCSTGACIIPMSPVYDGLVRFDPYAPGMSSVIGDLAKSWEVSDDNLQYTFHLRDAKWHDGSDFTADDVVATYQRITFPPLGVISIRGALFEAVDKIEKIDDKTVKFTLREPRGLFLSSLALAWNTIYQKKELEANDQDLKTVKLPQGTGPYKFVEYNVGEKWEHTRNDNYWNPNLPYLDGITIFQAHGPLAGRIFLSGQVDFGNSIGGPDIKAEAENMADTVVTLYKHPNFSGGWFNVNREPWGDARVRRAVHWAIDKSALRKGISHIQFAPDPGWLAFADPRHKAYWDTGTPLGDGTPTKDRIGWRTPTADDKAKALLADAGFANGFKDVDFVDRDIVWSRVYSPIFQGLLKQELGIETTLTTYPRALAFEKFAKGECDICVHATSMSLSLLEDYWGLGFWTKGPQNWGRWSNREFDDNYFEILRASAGPRKNALINKGMEILDEEVPMFISHSSEQLQAWRTWLKGHRRGLARTFYEPWRWEAAWLDN